MLLLEGLRPRHCRAADPEPLHGAPGPVALLEGLPRRGLADPQAHRRSNRM